ncbi:MAG: hypothetical protein ABIR79_04450 [Candidatus Binatia bacterium]
MAEEDEERCDKKFRRRQRAETQQKNDETMRHAMPMLSADGARGNLRRSAARPLVAAARNGRVEAVKKRDMTFGGAMSVDVIAR